MAPLTLTTPARTTGIENMNRQELVQRIDQLRASIQPIVNEINAMVTRLGVLDAEQRKIVNDSSTQLAELIADASYADDSSFVPSALDDQRRNNMNARQENYSMQSDKIRVMERKITDLRNIDETIATIEGRIIERQKQIDNLWLGGVFNPSRRRNLQITLDDTWKDLKQTKDLKPFAPQKIVEAGAELEAEKAILKRMQIDESYPANMLHALPAIAQLPRHLQAVLMTREPYDNTVTLRIPRSPDEVDFSRTVTLNIAMDPDAFINLVGNEIVVTETQNESENSLHDTVYYDMDIKDQPVPFPLEIVEVEGREVCRIPQAVWNVFGQ